MKLPAIKMPSFKMPGLKLPFGKGKADDDLDEDMEDDDAGAPVPTPRSEEGADTDTDVDEDDLEGLDEDDGDEFEGPDNRKRLIIIGGAVGAFLLVLLGGAVWYLFFYDPHITEIVEADPNAGVDDGSSLVERAATVTPPPQGPEGVPRVVATLPPRGAAGLMLPQGAAAPSAPTTGRTLPGGIGVEDPKLGLLVSAVTPASFVGIPDLPPPVPLDPAPVQGLFEEGDHGVLPRVGPDGRTPFQAYARPFSGAADMVRIAVIVKGLGLNRASTNAAIRKLPAEVTMAFSPYAQGVADWVRFSRERGHETLLELPMEPREFPVKDPGPYALRSLADPADNLRLLEFVMARGTGYVGLMGVMGSKYSQTKEQFNATLSHLKARGVMYVDGANTDKSLALGLAAKLSLPRARVDIHLDRVSSRKAIAEHLTRVEDAARKKAVVVLAVDPTPVVLEALAGWTKTLTEKGLVLAPVSALANKQLF